MNSSLGDTTLRRARLGARATVLLVVTMQAAQARNDVPLPRPRPADAPQAVEVDDKDAAALSDDAAKPLPPEQSPCRIALTEDIAIAPSISAIKGPGACGGEDLVRLEAVVLPDKRKVSVKPAAILRCTMASAVADWVRSDMAPLAVSLGSQLSELDNFDSFECRGRNRIVGAKMSEHGRANALDVRGLKLVNGNTISLTDRTVPRETREKVLASVCARFMTVLGPGSDWYHEDHIHLDLAERRNNFKLCQWGVYDPLPVVAPLMPAERPEDAPPRPTADEKAAQEKAAASARNAEEDNLETVDPTPTKPSGKKRRK